MNDKLKSKDYAELLAPLQLELNNLTHWLQHTRKRMVVIFEGRDTSGKGGVINAIAGTLNPRHVRTVALATPTERERSQWYFQRYVQHLPAAGELVLFDRSWYNRAGVEKVMGFCTDTEYRQFLKEAPRFEQQLVDDGILLFKYWLCCDQAEQEERFAERLADPLKRWKLSPIDLEARSKYAEYGRMRDEMLAAIRRGDWTAAEHIRMVFEPLENLRNALSPIRVLHDAVAGAGIAQTGPMLPLLDTIEAEHRPMIAAAAGALLAANGRTAG